jgi:hypothetical protein
MTALNILFIDDASDEERAKFVAIAQSSEIVFRHPAEVSQKDLEAAQVVVVDFRLDDGWSSRDSLSEIALKPMNGLALIAVLKSHNEAIQGGTTAFVLRSGHLDELTSGFAPESRLHVVSRQCGLDWALTKGGPATDQIVPIASLAKAVRQLPDSWASDHPQKLIAQVQQWLAIPNDSWCALAWQDVEDCHPPILELDKRTHGMRLVRWLLQRILPYPCFLLTIDRLAVRLCVTPVSLESGMHSGLREVFASSLYCGALADFDGQARWWRKGFESSLWDLTGGRSFDVKHTLALLNDRCAGALVTSGSRQPVLCLDDEFRILSEPREIEDAVRIQPDDWPSYADQAWAAVTDALIGTRIAAATIAADRARLFNIETRTDD